MSSNNVNKVKNLKNKSNQKDDSRIKVVQTILSKVRLLSISDKSV